MKNRINHDGKIFNSMTVIRDSENVGIRKVICVCLCGQEKVVALAKLKNGSTKSCGKCVYSSRYKHGMHGSVFYVCWENMIQRCTNESNMNYCGRGISLDSGWLNFENFHRDMQEGFSENLSLERINVNGNYEKSNCKWADKRVQSHNRRKLRGNSIYYGVHFSKRDAVFKASIRKGDIIYTHTSKNERECAEFYDKKSKELYNDEPNKLILKEK